MSTENLVDLVKRAGIVGAGGAGFPTHVKIDAVVDTVIVNGAECEPLLRVDQLLMDARADDMLKALEAVRNHTQAQEAIIGLKKKYGPAIDTLTKKLVDYPNIRLHILENFYPAGDEQSLVYETTKRIVPEGGIPLNVGALVINVETLIGIYDIMEKNKPVTDTYVTLTGEVKHPITVRVPLGIRVREALALAGGPTISQYAVVNGGPMMGKIVDPESTITKTTKGLIVLPLDHHVVESKNRPLSKSLKDAAVACMQCNLCTEVCPRYNLGHAMEPHKLMRLAAYASTCDMTTQATNAFLCCECALCQYACVMDLQPWKFHIHLKRELGSRGIKNPHHHQPKQANEFISSRHFNVKRLISRLGLTAYDGAAPLTSIDQTFDKVKILLGQHIGAPAQPVVTVGDMVNKGDLIGEIPEGALGARIFASIPGKVTAVENGSITIQS